MITRSQMRRQLRAQGGIMNVASRNIGGGGYTGTPMGSRTGFNIISKIGDRVRKLIPNELADVAVKAAPFVAPFFPGYAAIARGLGRFDQRGSISDALKQGAATYGFGKIAGKLGGAEGSEMGNVFGRQTYSMEGFKNKGLGRLFKGGEDKIINNKPDGTLPTPERKGLEVVQKGVNFVKDKVPILENLPDDVAQKLLVGGITSGASALYSYFTGAFDDPQQPGESMEEYMARRNTRVKQQMRGYMDSYYTPLRNPQYAAMSDQEKNNYIDSIVGQGMATGGRVGYQTGGISMSNTLAQNIAANRAQAIANQGVLQAARNKMPTGLYNNLMNRVGNRAAHEALNQNTGGARGVAAIVTGPPTQNDISAAINANRNVNRIQTGPRPGELDPLGLPMTSMMLPNMADGSMRSLAQEDAIRNRVLAAQEANKPTYQERLMGESWETLSDNDQYRIAQEYPGETPPRRNPSFVPNMNQGGRVGLMGGTMPMGEPRVNQGGITELDYRAKGGFVPVGIKEKADDVPAMLSKNEFVFTADAVRGAGNGSVEKGAQKMYDTMKNLERRVT
jgi:hypothetical protein